MSHPVSHQESGTADRANLDTVIPTSGRRRSTTAAARPPGSCQSQGLTRSPASKPYQPRKGLDLDPAIERIEKTKKEKKKECLLINGDHNNTGPPPPAGRHDYLRATKGTRSAGATSQC